MPALQAKSDLSRSVLELLQSKRQPWSIRELRAALKARHVDAPEYAVRDAVWLRVGTGEAAFTGDWKVKVGRIRPKSRRLIAQPRPLQVLQLTKQ